MKFPQFLINTRLRGHDLKFKTTFGIFSYKEIDPGSAMLIRSMDMTGTKTCLDLGCGYGPIGITMAKQNPQAQVYMVDRDFIALEYAEKNCRLNKLSNTDCRLSNGFSNLEKIQFDLVASNLPYHTSHDMLTWILYEAKHQMVKGGKFYVVTMNKLKPFIQREFEKIFGNYTKVCYDKMYTVSVTEKE
jgi:16S rRNA G1207 methylase RsmC